MQLFISANKVNEAGLILAGSADFKTELSQSPMFDQRLQSKVLKLVDISYGGENRSQGIKLSADLLSKVKSFKRRNESNNTLMKSARTQTSTVLELTIH